MRQYELIFTGKGISVNDVRGGNWRSTHTRIKKLKESICWLILEAKIPKLKQYRIDLIFNGGYDIDNCSYMVKICSDCLKLQGKIIDDTKKFYKGISIAHDETLPPNTFKFIISEVQ